MFTPDGSLGGRYQIPCALQALLLQALNQAIVCAEETTSLIHHSIMGRSMSAWSTTSDLPNTALPLLPEVLVTPLTML